MLPTHDDSGEPIVDLVAAEQREQHEQHAGANEKVARASARGWGRVATHPAPRLLIVSDEERSPGAAATAPADIGATPRVPTLEIPELRTFSMGYRALKRATDIVVSIVVLALTWPLIVLIAIVIRCDSRGPALFRGERIARGGTPFRFWKFRTMYVDARERWPELYAKTVDPNECEETFYKQMVDPRHTRVGRIIRRTSLDELPNFVSVLRGHVSLVGPRPETFDWARHYHPHQLAKFSVKPGLTGLAVVSGRNELNVRQTIEFDLEYVARASFVYDCVIMVRTVGVVVRMLGAV